MNVTPNQPPLEELSPKDACDRAWAYYQHADNLHAGRLNFFLVAESMLITGFVTLGRTEIFLRVWLVCLALFYTGSWWYVNARLERRLASLIADLKRDPIYVRYVESVGGMPAGAVLSNSIPPVTFIFWVGFLLNALLSK